MKDKKKPRANATLSLKVPQDFKDDLQKVSKILGLTMTEYIMDRLNQELTKFRSNNGHGKVEPVPAYRLKGFSEYEKRILKSICKDLPKDKVKCDCLVLDDVPTNANQPRYKIYDYESQQVRYLPHKDIEFKDNLHE